MSGTLPLLESGSAYKYPVVQRSGWLTRVNQFVDFSEQRWIVRQPLAEFVLKYRDVSRVDLATLKTFFETQLGAYDTWSMEFDGTLYEDMVFDQDNFSPVEDKQPNRFTIEFKVKQTRPAGWFNAPTDVAGNTPEYPMIGQFGIPGGAPNVTTQRPWTGAENYYTNRVDLESGPRYSFSWLGTPLKRWELNYPALDVVDKEILRNFFESMHGRMHHFNFNDPELFLAARQTPHSWATPNPAYLPIPNCRFDIDQLEIQHIQAGQWSTRVFIAEYVPSNFDGLPT